MKVSLYTPDDLRWPMGHHDAHPSYLVGVDIYPHGNAVHVDPYPCYTPDLKLVEDLTAQCCEKFPLLGHDGAELAIVSHEFISRTNGCTYNLHKWSRIDGKQWKQEIKSPFNDEMRNHDGIAHLIVLSGKRIPIHPAWIRHLVCHEYGHAAFNHATRAFGYLANEQNLFYKEYMAMRGVTEWAKSYDGGKWHLSPCEIVANDFRTIVMGQGAEYWPHTCVHPHELRSKLEGWWAQALERIKAVYASNL